MTWRSRLESIRHHRIHSNMIAATSPTRREVRIALGLTFVSFVLIAALGTILGDPPGYDFAVFYTGGQIIHQGNAAKLYDFAEQARIEWQLCHRKELLAYIHPPFEAFLFAALARLPYLKADVLWGVLNSLFWLLFQHLLRPYVKTPRHPYRYLLLCLTFFPFLITLAIGQTSVLLLLLFALTFISLERGHDFRAGIFLGLGLYKFPIVLPFSLICLLRKKWRMMAGFAMVALALGVLSWLVVGLAGIRSYAHLLLDIAKNTDNPIYLKIRAWKQMPTFKGLIAALMGGRLATFQAALLVAVSVASLFFMAWRWREEDQRGSGGSLSLMFAAALTVALLTAPYLYIYDLTLMLLPVVLVIGSPQWPAESGQRRILFAIIAVLYAPPIYLVLLKWQATYLLAPVLAAFALAALRLARGNDSGEASHTVMVASRIERLCRLIGGKAEMGGLFG